MANTSGVQRLVCGGEEDVDPIGDEVRAPGLSVA